MRGLFNALQRRDKGFTMVEVLVASSVAGVVAGVTSIAVGAGFRMSSNIDERSVTQVAASQVMAGVSDNITLADPLMGMSTTSVSMIVQRNNICELHTYYMKTGTNRPSSLNQKVQEIPVSNGIACKDIDQTLWTTAPTTIDRLELDGIVTSVTGVPVFTFYAPAGGKVNVPGDTGYDALNDLKQGCDIVRVQVTLSIKDAAGDVKTFMTNAAPRALSYGYGGCGE